VADSSLQPVVEEEFVRRFKDRLALSSELHVVLKMIAQMDLPKKC
jgi:hypothetical protein